MATLDDRQLQDWLNEHGGEKSRRTVTIERANPDYDAVFDPRQRVKIDVAEITAADGTKIALNRAMSEADAARVQELMAAYPDQHLRIYDVVPAGELPAARVPPAPAPPQERNNNGRRERWDAASKTWVDVGPAVNSSPTAGAQTRAQVAPTPTANLEPVKDPNSGRIVGLRDPKTGQTIPLPAPKDPAKPEILQLPGGRLVRISPDGQTIEDVTPANPADRLPTQDQAPRFSPGQVTADLTRYAEYLRGEVAAGRLSPEQASRMMANRLDTAKVYLGEQNTAAEAGRTVLNEQTAQRGQDVSLSTNRLNNATTQFGTAAQTALALNPYLKKGSDLGGKVLLGLIELGRRSAQQFGGLNDIPRTEIPVALQGLANNPPWATGQTAQPTTPTGGPPASGNIRLPAMAPVQQPQETQMPTLPPLQPMPGQPNPDTDLPTSITDLARGGPPLADTANLLRSLGFGEDVIAEGRRAFLGAA